MIDLPLEPNVGGRASLSPASRVGRVTDLTDKTASASEIAPRLIP